MATEPLQAMSYIINRLLEENRILEQRDFNRFEEIENLRLQNSNLIDSVKYFSEKLKKSRIELLNSNCSNCEQLQNVVLEVEQENLELKELLDSCNNSLIFY